MKSKLVTTTGRDEKADLTFRVPHLEEAFPNVARGRLEKALESVCSRWGLGSSQCDTLESSGIPSEERVSLKDE